MAYKAGDLIKDASGTTWRRTEGGNWRAEDGPNKGKLFKDVGGKGDPVAGGAAPSQQTAAAPTSYKTGDKVTDAQGVVWRKTEGGHWRRDDTGALFNNGGAGDPVSASAASQSTGQPGLPQYTNGPAPSTNPLNSPLAPVSATQHSTPFDFISATGTAPTQLVDNFGSFIPLQKKTEAEGRRITYDEWLQQGGNPYDYYKLYGGNPDQTGLAQLQNLAMQQGRRITFDEWIRIGGDPNQFFQLYGGTPDPVMISELSAKAKNENRRVTFDEWIKAGGNPWTYEQSTANDPYLEGIAKQGTVSKGTTLGDVREVMPSQIEKTTGTNAVTIDPVERITQNPQVGDMNVLDPTNSAFYEKQKALAAALEQQAAGQGPSLANLQLQEALEAALKNQMGALAGTPGVNAAMASRLFGYQAGDARRNAALAAAQTRMAEQLAARQQLNEILASGRAQDTAIQQGNQSAINQGILTQSDVDTRVALSNQLAGNTQAYNQAQLIQQSNQYNADTAYQRAVQQAKLAQEAAIANQNAFNARNTAQGQISGGIKQSELGAKATIEASENAADATVEASENSLAGDLLTDNNNSTNLQPTTPRDPNVIGSDKKFKKNISPGGDEAEDMMDKLAAAIFEYKNKKRGAGKQVGVMAQDLEKSKLGKQMVENRGDGKYVNFAKGLGAVLAAQADLNKRMKALEGRL